MSRALVNRLFEVVDTANWEAMPALFHSDVVYERPGYAPFVGIDRLLQFYRHERVIAGGKHHIDKIVVDGDACACWGTFVGVSRDGAPLQEAFADVYAIEDGKIRKRKSFFFRPAV
ncbi:MAG: nuclear transport factor 2 family protein [Acidobacteria bacterium]|nr:nuclear transport factor 2 family protein [Acidobacteriota bacterium]